MAIPNLEQIIPDGNARKVVYRVTAALGLLLFLTQSGFAAAQAGQPTWLTVALSVYGVLAASGFLVAQANTPTGPAEQRGVVTLSGTSVAAISRALNESLATALPATPVITEKVATAEANME